jgi:UDP-3-O-[3-hydroxymyristoyl] glucosamine N-acyltransferase
MKVEELMSLDDTLRCSSQSGKLEFVSITTPDALANNHLVFIRTYDYFKKLKEKLSESIISKLGVILDHKLKLGPEDRRFLEERTSLFESSNIERSICILSRFFYDRIFNTFDLSQDGREDGSAQIHPSAKIADKVFIGQNVSIGRNVTILNGSSIMANCSIQDETIIFPSVTLYPKTQIGRRCRVHTSCSIGSDGFGYNFIDGAHQKIWHFGGVVIEDDVELGALSAVDGGTFSPTRIGRGSKIDNQVQVGHNCVLGQGVILCGQTGLSGSCTIGDFAILGGKAGTGQGISLGRGVQVAGGALVNQSWPEGAVIAGHPARPLREWLKGVAFVRKMALAKKEQNQGVDDVNR